MVVFFFIIILQLRWPIQLKFSLVSCFMHIIKIQQDWEDWSLTITNSVQCLWICAKVEQAFNRPTIWCNNCVKKISSDSFYLHILRGIIRACHSVSSFHLIVEFLVDLDTGVWGTTHGKHFPCEHTKRPTTKGSSENTVRILKGRYTFGNCQRPVFLLGVSHHNHKITSLWKFGINWSSKLRENDERKNTRVGRICVLSDKNKRLLAGSLLLFYLFLKNYVTSEGVVSHNVLYYQQVANARYQVSF